MPSSTPRLRPLGLLLLALSALTVVCAQLETVEDTLGNTIIQSVVTDVNGDPLQTLILSTLTADAAAVTPPVADPATETETETSTTDTATATATDTEVEVGVGQPAVVQQPAATCTTEGCPPRPTTYTLNGVITTWYATTPETPVPTWTSSGQIVNIANYITSTASGSGSGATRLPGNGASSRYSSLSLGTAGDWGIMAGVAIVGGLVGAVAVL
ncbi:hypothetical protein JCM6882_002127 [Rhodosporidiobolus microsporus]